MIIKQISIFLNNSVGRLTEVTTLLGKENVNLKAFTLSESSDFGLLRIITDNNQKAFETLKSAGYAAAETDVVFMSIKDDNPGALSKIMKCLSDKGISVEYMYAFSTEDGAHIVIKTADIELCNNILAEYSH